MPRAKKVCSHWDCPNTQPCEIHGRKAWEGSRRKERTTVSSYRATMRRRYMLRRDKLTCASCGRVALEHDLEVDHIKPLAEGGPDTTKNCQLLCLDCHSQKTQAEAQRGRQVGE
jgi:5-methylcytosine-specific restriction enzyme A